MELPTQVAAVLAVALVTAVLVAQALLYFGMRYKGEI
jgi:hypothetical protein